MVKLLILINVGVFLANMLTGGRLQDVLLLHPWYVRQGQVWRLVTYQFCHAGFWHLFCNMYGLHIFGPAVERLLGNRRFLQMYLFSGVVGALCWLLANWNGAGAAQILTPLMEVQNITYPDIETLRNIQEGYRILSIYGGCVGASGALFGVMLAAAMAFPNVVISLIFPPISMHLKNFVICYGILEAVMAMDSASSNVAHLAHLGGMLGAFLYMNRLRHRMQFSLADWLRLKWRRRKTDSTKETGSNQYSCFSQDASSKEIDAVLEKMSTHGYESLTEREKAILKMASQRLRR